MTNSISTVSRICISVVNHVSKLLQDDKPLKKIFWLALLTPEVSLVYFGTECWNWNEAVTSNQWGKRWEWENKAE